LGIAVSKKQEALNPAGCSVTLAGSVTNASLGIVCSFARSNP
jgi:hypothetical protein